MKSDLRYMAALPILLIWTISCSASPDDPETRRTPQPSGPSNSAPAVDPSASDSTAEISDAGREAQDIMSRTDVQIAAFQQKFGEGTKSPCSASSSSLFSSDCAEAVSATSDVLEATNTALPSSGGYATLRSVLKTAGLAVDGYEDEKCAENPSDAATRTACVSHGAVIAQTPADLHNALRAGLAGN
jgi:hypothetical protein